MTMALVAEVTMIPPGSGAKEEVATDGMAG